MTVLRLTHSDNTKLDVRPSDVAEITATSRTTPDSLERQSDVVVEVDAGVRDNYRYLARSVEFVDRDSDSNIPLQ